jgi:microcystin-dependent protein
MPEIADVIASEVIEDGWGNAIRDRTIQRYDDESTRTSESPTPGDGDLSFLEDTGDLSVFFDGSWRTFVPTGTLSPFAGSSAPPGWLVANGAEISRATYARLFVAIGTAFGNGDGSTTFNIPDLRGAFPLGVAVSGTGSTRGATGGSIDHTHTGPSHTHTGPSHTHTGPSHIHTMGTHTHTGPSHTHTGPSHTHGPGTLDTDTEPNHTHSFSDTSGGPSSTSAEWNNGSVFSGASTTHTHSVSGTTGSGGTHQHAVDSGATAASGTAATGASGTGATGATDPGDTAASGTAATGASGTAATGASGTADTGTANPPFVAVNYIIKT